MAKIDSDSPVPKWHQLKTALLQRIESQDYEPDEIFCKQQELMDKYGVSYITVSRALSELVREGYCYRKRGVGTFVRAAADREMPAPVESGAQAESVGLLVWDREHMLEHPAFSLLVAGLSEPLRAAGFNLSFIFADAELASSGRLAEVVQRARVRALVAPPQPLLTQDSLRPLSDKGLPVIPLNLDFPEVGPCAVHCDIAKAIELATSHLLSCGYSRIALMVPGNDEAPRRIIGYQRALRTAGVDEQLIFTEPTKRPLPMEVRHVLGDLKPRVGLVASDDIAAQTAMRTAQEMGWVVPEELGVVGVGDFLSPELFDPPLTTIHIPLAEMGRIAGQMVLSLLGGNMPVPAVQNLMPQLVVRSTTLAGTNSVENIVKAKAR